MLIHKVWIGEANDEWRFGQGNRVNRYRIRNVSPLNLDRATFYSGEVKNLLEGASNLRELFNPYDQALLVPELFDWHNPDKIELMKTTGRSGVELNNGNVKKIIVSLEPLFGKEFKNEKHELIVGRKGIGMPSKLSKTTKDEIMSWIKERYNDRVIQTITGLYPEMLDIITRAEKSSKRPEGGLDMITGMADIKCTEYFLGEGKDLGIKINPVVYALRYTEQLMGDVQALTHGSLEKTVEYLYPHEQRRGAQEIRLLFGDLRGGYIEHAEGDLLTQLMLSLNTDVAYLQNIVERCYKDVVRILEVIPKQTRYKDNLILWIKLGDVHRVYNQEKYPKGVNKFISNRYGWYILKDITISGIGVSFLDLEAILIECACNNLDEVNRRQQWAFTVQLKDYLHLLGQLEIGLEQVRHGNILELNEKQKIETEARQKLYSMINKSPFFKLIENREELTLVTQYEHIADMTFAIKKANIPLRWFEP